MDLFHQGKYRGKNAQRDLEFDPSSGLLKGIQLCVVPWFKSSATHTVKRKKLSRPVFYKVCDKFPPYTLGMAALVTWSRASFGIGTGRCMETEQSGFDETA